MKHGLEDKILALKHDLIKVIYDKIRCSKRESDPLISETVLHISNVNKSVPRQINKLKNKYRENPLVVSSFKMSRDSKNVNNNTHPPLKTTHHRRFGWIFNYKKLKLSA